MKAIRRQHVAVEALASEARRQTPGPASSRGEGTAELRGPVLPLVDRDRFIRAIGRKIQTCDNKPMADFKKQTKRTANKKRFVAVWAGEESGHAQLHRKGDKPTTQASSPPRGSSHSSREIPGEDLLSVVSEEPGAGGYELLPTSHLAAARGFQVPSLPSGQP